MRDIEEAGKPSDRQWVGGFEGTCVTVERRRTWWQTIDGG